MDNDILYSSDGKQSFLQKYVLLRARAIRGYKNTGRMDTVQTVKEAYVAWREIQKLVDKDV